MKKKMQGDGQFNYFSTSGYDYSEKLYLAEMQSAERDIEEAKRRRTEEDLQRFRLSAGLSTKLQQPVFVSVKDKKGQGKSATLGVIIAKRKRNESSHTRDILAQEQKGNSFSSKSTQFVPATKLEDEKLSKKDKKNDKDSKKSSVLSILNVYSDDEED